MNVLRFPGPRPPEGERAELDGAARARIRASLDESLLVEAAAGTGKTTVLVERLVAMLQTGRATVDRVVAVTFTRKAAGELKLRLRQELEKARSAAEGDQLERVEEAIAHLEQARIGTIHSFCAELLRERPVEARIDPGFEGVADDEAPKIYRQAFDRWVQERLEEMPPGLRRALSRLALEPGWGEGSPIDRLRDAGLRLIEWRDFPATWRRESFDRERAIDVLAEWSKRLAGWSERCANTYDELRRSLEPVRLLWTWIDRREAEPPRGAGLPRDYDALEARFLELRRQLSKPWNRRKGSGKFAEALPREQVVEARDTLVEQLEEFRRVADADLAALLQAELAGATERYEERKRGLGKLDFQDLLIKARDVLRDHRAVREHFQARFSHLFVDEFQDTDPLQAEILLLLAADDPDQDDWRAVTPVAGKLFVVGDPKQSIYRFRRADIDLYRRVKEGLVRRGVGLVHLTRSFRATSQIQRFVNRAFAPEMDGDASRGSPEYIPLEKHRDPIEGQPPVVALPVPRPYGVRQLSGKAIDESLPDATAAWVKWLLHDSGWRVEDPETRELVPVQAHHVCLLFRRYLSWRTDVTRAYTRALEARGVPHLLIGARTFHQREEVETLRAALHAVEWPDDELTAFATLRGSLFAFPDDLLLRFSRARGLDPMRWRLRGEGADGLDPELEEVGEALDALAVLHRRRNDRALVETLQELLELTRAHAGFALRPAGHQVLGNVERVLELARRYELAGGRSFRGFVEQLEEEAAKPNSTEAPLVEEGAQGVRLMTVHTAKGLEYPVVVLADMTAKISRSEPDLALDAERGLCAIKLLGCAPHELLDRAEEEAERDRTEGARIAYVAATRARDLLVVPAVGDGPWSGWLEPLNKALYPPAEGWRRGHPVEGCPRFGESSVLERPMHHDGDLEGSVRPGLHGFAEEGYSVVWWDPAALELGVEGAQGLRHEDILAPSGEAALESRHRYEEWKAREAEIRASARTPSLRVVAVTELEEEAPGPATGDAEIMIEVCARDAGRPSGKRFGALVHRVLELVELDAEPGAVQELVELQARLLDAPAEERAAGAAAVAAALGSASVRAARGALDLMREAPFTLRLEDGRLVEGTIDLLYREREDGPWTVVDFKTEPDVDRWREVWERQVGWYVRAADELLGGGARGVVLAV